MTDSTHFKCECQHCGGHLESPVEASGLTVDCLHCGQPTVLIAPDNQPTASRSAKVILLAGLGASLLAALILGIIVHGQHTAKLREQAAAAAQLAARQAAAAEALAKDPLAQAGWKVSAVRLEKMPGSSIIHAVGTLTNNTERRRFGVKIKFDLFDAGDQKIAGANDYLASIEPHDRWQFSALVVDARAITATVAAVEESP